MTRLLGIDFSGARDAGRRIWIAEGWLEEGRLRVEALARAADLPGGGRAREAALPALRRHLAEAGDAVVGLDVPNALPRELLEGPWEPWAAGFAQTHPTADAFRAACRAQTGGKELRRACDRKAQTPFSPYNLRIYRQTWSYLAEVVAPLLADGAATVWPFQPRRAGCPHLLEICPASTLKRLALYRPYKGRSVVLRGSRDDILSALLTLTAAALPPTLRQQALDDPGGDALDALIALLATAEAVRDGCAERFEPHGEGDVYVWRGAERATSTL